MASANPPTSNQAPVTTMEKINPVWIVCLLLAYTAAAQVAAANGLERLVTENAEHNEFSSPEVLLTFMRVGVLVWSVTASFLQALVLRLIYKGARRTLAASNRRLAIFFAIITIVNSVLLVAGGTA